MKSRLKKKLDKANAFYEHQPWYTPFEVMRSYYWWKKYLRRHEILPNTINRKYEV